MNFDLKGKTALITGASQGLGARFATVLAEAGVKVILVARRLDKLQALANQLKVKGFDAQAFMVDISDKKSISHLFQRLKEQGERIDICINNAATFKMTPIFSEENDDFEKVMQTNVIGLWNVTKAVTQQMKCHKIAGSIINIASVNGANRLAAEIAGHCASKAAVMQMTKALVGELASAKIRINCIVPGVFHTPLTDPKVGTPEGRAELEALIPLGFVAEPSDLDGIVLYLASNKASRYVTGSFMTVDGGLSWGG